MASSECARSAETENAIATGTVSECLYEHAQACPLCGPRVRVAAAAQVRAQVEGPGVHVSYERLRSLVASPGPAEPTRTALEQHLRACGVCRRRLRAMQTRQRAAQVHNPQPLTSMMLDARPARRMAWKPALVAAPALALIALALWPTLLVGTSVGVWSAQGPFRGSPVTEVAHGKRVWPRAMETSAGAVGTAPQVRGGGQPGQASSLWFTEPWYHGLPPGTTTVHFTWNRPSRPSEKLRLGVGRADEVTDVEPVIVGGTGHDWVVPGPGLYIAWIEGLDDSTPRTYFRVLTPEEQAVVDRAQGDDPFLRAVVYERLGLLSPAAEAYGQALAQHPRNERLADTVRELAPFRSPAASAPHAEDEGHYRGAYLPIR